MLLIEPTCRGLADQPRRREKLAVNQERLQRAEEPC
jgi:hypothetical protein